jgi:hypothetical protein
MLSQFIKAQHERMMKDKNPIERKSGKKKKGE